MLVIRCSVLHLACFLIKAARHIHLGHTDVEGRWSVFGQAFRQVCDVMLCDIQVSNCCTANILQTMADKSR